MRRDVVGAAAVAAGDLERGDRPGGVEDLEVGEDQHADGAGVMA